MNKALGSGAERWAKKHARGKGRQSVFIPLQSIDSQSKILT